MNDNSQAQKPNLVPAGSHPVAGYTKLNTQVGVYRTRLRPVNHKRDLKHADYYGDMQLANAKVHIYIWVHTDGTLGLRLAKSTPRKESK
jgi:hypothetical protein